MSLPITFDLVREFLESWGLGFDTPEMAIQATFLILLSIIECAMMLTSIWSEVFSVSRSHYRYH